jgi:protein TonB
MNEKGIKYAGAVTGAVLITLALFLMMTRMISGASQGGAQLEHYDVVDFVRLVRESHPVDKEHRTLPPEEKPPPPPPPPDLAVQQAAPPQPAPMPMPALNMDVRLGGAPVIGRLAPPVTPPALDNEVIPLVQIPPVYPVRAERLRLGGSVVVEFTITAAGGVRDPVVVQSDPPRIFDQAAVQAILRWKFKPKLEEGKPVARRARQRFEFTPPEQP